MKFWRFPAAEIPSERDELTSWLYSRWLELDEWIAQARLSAGVEAIGKAAAPV
jgi:hypothetical protein